jgi:predicted transcriptional regulator
MTENDTSKQSESPQELSTRLRLERIAKSRGVDLQMVVLEAIEQFLEREEDRVEWIRQGDDALKNFNETGLHLTGAEVDAWLAPLEEGEEVDPPPCHI